MYCLIMKAYGRGQKKFNIQFPSLELNAENRLIMASNNSTVVTFAYDYMGRRFRKIVHDGTTATTNYYIYDGWNMIQELTYSQTHTLTNYYTWGLDLSGSLQGVPLRQGYGGHAGGIGGLLSCSSRSASGTETYYPVTDANGNITEYVTTNGTVAAHYEYNPFGGIIASSGTKASDFHFRFSTKYFDDETGLYNYGMRDLDVELGRWISRDPIGEEGGINIYGFVGNNSVDFVDSLGNIASPILIRTLNLIRSEEYSTLGYCGAFLRNYDIQVSPVQPSSGVVYQYVGVKWSIINSDGESVSSINGLSSPQVYWEGFELNGIGTALDGWKWKAFNNTKGKVIFTGVMAYRDGDIPPSWLAPGSSHPWSGSIPSGDFLPWPEISEPKSNEIRHRLILSWDCLCKLPYDHPSRRTRIDEDTIFQFAARCVSAY